MTKALILIFILIIGCTENRNIHESRNKELLDGLYEVEILDSGYKFIWIFSDSTSYKLSKGVGNYNDVDLDVSYESPINFYIKDDLVIFCGLNSDGSPVSISDCLKSSKEARFKIIDMDTLYDGYNKTQSLVLQLRNSEEKYQLKKIFYDTITREINVTKDIFDLIDTKPKFK